MQEYEVLKCNLTSHSLSRFFINLNSHYFSCIHILVFFLNSIPLIYKSWAVWLFFLFASPISMLFVYVLETMKNWESLPFLMVLFFWFIKTLIILVRCVACFLLVAWLCKSSFNLVQVETWFDEPQLQIYAFKKKKYTRNTNFVYLMV